MVSARSSNYGYYYHHDQGMQGGKCRADRCKGHPLSTLTRNSAQMPGRWPSAKYPSQRQNICLPNPAGKIYAPFTVGVPDKNIAGSRSYLFASLPGRWRPKGQSAPHGVILLRTCHERKWAPNEINQSIESISVDLSHPTFLLPIWQKPLSLNNLL